MNLTKTLLFVFLASPLFAQQVWYVNHSAAGTGMGNTWANALPRLQYALEAAQPGDTVWVAQGTYYTSLGGNRDERFNIPAGVAVYGGFAGHETQWSQRNPALFPTILSGDIGVPNDIADNAYTVVYFHLPNEMTTLDGFTIRDGNADYNPPISPAPDDPRICGGGVYVFSKSTTSKLVISNCIITVNRARYGAGGYINARENGKYYLYMSQCNFTNNHSLAAGASLFLEGDTSPESVVFDHINFESNTSQGQKTDILIRPGSQSGIIRFNNCGFLNKNTNIELINLSSGSITDLMFDRCLFQNLAISGISMFAFGNGILSLNNCMIRNNNCSANFIETSSSVVISGCLFEANMGKLLQFSLLGTQQALIKNTNFNNCNASYIISSTPFLHTTNIEINQCNFTNNNISGGMVKDGYGVTSLSNCTISNNKCQYLLSGVKKIKNCVLSRNEVLSGIIYDETRLIRQEIINSTFYQSDTIIAPFINKRSSQVISRNYPDTLLLRNSIFAYSDTVDRPYIFGHNTWASIQNCLFWADSCTQIFEIFPVETIIDPNTPPVYQYLGGLACSDNIFASGHPFQNVESGDFSLRPCSPPVNAGSNAWLGSSDTLDAAGGLRVINGIVDMGALELPARPGISISEQHIIPVNCATGTLGSIAILPDTARGPLEFQWSNGATEPILQQLPPGMYDLTITDADGCDTTFVFDMPIAGSLPVAVTISPIICRGDANGRVVASPVYTALPQSFVWNTGAQTPDINQLGAGQYSVEITNGLGCTGQAAILMEEPDSLSTTAEITPAGNSSGGSIVITSVQGGRAPYELRWSNGATNDRLENIPAGAYALSVTDAGGCTRVFNFVVGMVNAAAAVQDISTKIKLFPNPASEWLHFELEHEWIGIFHLEICNSQGQSLLRFPLEKNNQRISFQADIAALPSGVYTARLRGAAISAGLKFVKM